MLYTDIENIAKAGKNLNIDCIPAVVGWDFHGGFSHVVSLLIINHVVTLVVI